VYVWMPCCSVAILPCIKSLYHLNISERVMVCLRKCTDTSVAALWCIHTTDQVGVTWVVIQWIGVE
jgi:hypothetical protein